MSIKPTTDKVVSVVLYSVSCWLESARDSLRNLRFIVSKHYKHENDCIIKRLDLKGVWDNPNTECLLGLFCRRQKEEKGLKKAKPEVRANSLN